MVEPILLRNLAWAVTSMLELVLLAWVVRRKMYHSYPFFFLYILTAILQSVLAFSVYQQWGFLNPRTWNVVWASQGVMVALRGLAVLEIVRRILVAYSGVWTLVSRILLAGGILAFTACLLFPHRTWQEGVMDADRGVELAIAVVIVMMFLLARYYGLEARGSDRLLALGFCLYSCFYVINFTFFEKWLAVYVSFWNFLDILAFLATLLIWIWTAKSYQVFDVKVGTANESPLGISVQGYSRISRKLNERLAMLNKRLNHLLGSQRQGH